MMLQQLRFIQWNTAKGLNSNTTTNTELHNIFSQHRIHIALLQECNHTYKQPNDYDLYRQDSTAILIHKSLHHSRVPEFTISTKHWESVGADIQLPSSSHRITVVSFYRRDIEGTD